VRIQQKVHWETLFRTFVFHSVGSGDHIVHSGASKARNVDALLFMLGWDCCSFHKKCTGTRYDKLVFLHPVGSIGHVVHCGVTVREMLM
jgi:hypothetical protein